ncbi:cytochrome c-type biogenesis protein [Billgrantia antri]|uniref:Cytochrome c-type biogenesis protein n=1 Tax=Billgrantia antri TaxID=2846777 RepID=A0ABS6ZKI7_9GAMM|nr:cytochrome c-type biogenesis protein [Halomonas antri]MBW6390573.1 cytochrome c-type biogenesis protein CcmH [Halomonas antri]
MAVIRWFFVILLLATGMAHGGAVEVREFSNPVLEQRYQSLTASLRCPKCQNQAINDSDSPISQDMRERVYAMLQDGRSDMEIRDHMVQRFGDYVLYNPRLEGRTYLLWGLPAVLVVAGAVLVMLLIRARRNASVRALSNEERHRLEALIKQEKGQ